MTELMLVKGMWFACFVAFAVITIYAIWFYFTNIK